jgi:hypothetical protein
MINLSLFLLNEGHEKYFVTETVYGTSVLISRLNMNCWSLINRVAVVIRNTEDVHWQKPVIICLSQRNGFF